jgi:hypothetical protein
VDLVRVRNRLATRATGMLQTTRHTALPRAVTEARTTDGNHRADGAAGDQGRPAVRESTTTRLVAPAQEMLPLVQGVLVGQKVASNQHVLSLFEPHWRCAAGAWAAGDRTMCVEGGIITRVRRPEISHRAWARHRGHQAPLDALRALSGPDSRRRIARTTRGIP